MPLDILVAVDDTPASAAAISTAAALASARDARVTLLNVVDVTVRDGLASSSLGWYFPLESRAALRLLARVEDMLPSGTPATRVVGWGDPVDGILRQVASGGHDLVVVGSRGRGAVRSALTGSVSRRVLERCPAPVLIAPPRHDHASHGELSRIVVAVDGSPSSDAAIALTRRIAEGQNAVIDLITVNVVPWSMTPVDQVTMDEVFAAMAADTAAVQDRAARRLEGVGTIERDAPWTSSAGRTIIEAAETADLVVIGSRGRGPVRRALLGSVSHDVLEHSAAPVLIVSEAARVRLPERFATSATAPSAPHVTAPRPLPGSGNGDSAARSSVAGIDPTSSVLRSRSVAHNGQPLHVSGRHHRP